MFKWAVLIGILGGLWIWGTVPEEQRYTYGAAVYYASNFEWVELTGPWVLTHYGTNEDEYLGERTGASWNGIEAPDWSQPGEWMPDEVTLDHGCIAMPGPEFYGLPIMVCVQGVCTVGTAVDVPALERLRLGGDFYMHADLCNKPATELNIVGTGIITGARVYVGRCVSGDEQWQ